MGTSWKDESVSISFNLYNDMLESILGFHTIFQIISEKSINSILDFGCGPGKVSKRMALLNINYKIIAVDQSKNMIDIAQKERSQDNITYQVIQNECLDFIPSESIDTAILCFVIINNSSSERVSKILSEIYRVLKKNGSLIILDSHPNAAGTEFTTFRNGEKGKIYKEGDNKKQYLKIPQQKDLVLDDWYWMKESYLNWLHQTGFGHMELYEPTIAALSREDREAFELEYDFKQWGNEMDIPPFIILKVNKD